MIKFIIITHFIGPLIYLNVLPLLKMRQEILHIVTILINRDNGWKTFPCFRQANGEKVVFSSFVGTWYLFAYKLDKSSPWHPFYCALKVIKRCCLYFHRKNMSTWFILSPGNPGEEVRKLKSLWTVSVAKRNSMSSFSHWNFKPRLWRWIRQRTFGQRKKARPVFACRVILQIWQMLQRGKYNLWANILNLHCVSSRARGCALVSPEDLWVRQMFSQSSHVWFWAGCRSPSKCAVKSIPHVLFQLCPSARQCAIFCAVMLYYRAIYYLFPITESRL